MGDGIPGNDPVESQSGPPLVNFMKALYGKSIIKIHIKKEV